MGAERLVWGLGSMLTAGIVACGTPDAPSNTESKPSTDQPAATSGQPGAASSHADTIREIIDPVLQPCYSVQFPDGALSRPVALHHGFTGQVFLAVEADTGSQQLLHFRLQAVRLDRRQDGSEPLRRNFAAGEPVPDSLARLLPQLAQHIRKLRPRVLVSSNKSCVMPSQWIIPIRVR